MSDAVPSVALPLKNNTIFLWFAAAWSLKSKVYSVQASAVVMAPQTSLAAEVPPSNLANKGAAFVE